MNRAFTLVFCCVVCSSLAAQEKPVEGWVGKLVYLKHSSGARFHDTDGKEIKTGLHWNDMPAKVLRATTSWVFVRDESDNKPKTGWVLRSSVLLVDDAIKHYTDSIRVIDNDRTTSEFENKFAYQNRAAAWLEKEDYKKAIADADKALQLWDFQARLGKIGGQMFLESGPPYLSHYYKGKAYFALEDYEQACKCYTRSLDHYGKFWLAHRDRGVAHLASEKFAVAVKDFTAAIALNPSDALTFDQRGLARQYNDQPELALADYTEAIRLDPESARHYRERALLHKDMGNYKLAAEDMTSAIRIEPKEFEHYYVRGTARLFDEDYAKALADFDEAIRLGGTKAEFYLGRGMAYLRTSESDKAIKDFTTAIEKDPKRAGAYLRRGQAWTIKGEYEIAVLDFNQGIALRPDYADLFASRAKANDELGKHRKAVSDFEEACRIEPKNQLMQAELALRLATSPDAACRDGKRALALALKSCEANEWKSGWRMAVLAAAYAETGEFEKAVEYQKKALAMPTYLKSHGVEGMKWLTSFATGKPVRFEVKKQ